MRVQGDSGQGYVQFPDGTVTTTLPTGFGTGPVDTQQIADGSNNWRHTGNHYDAGHPGLPPPVGVVDPNHPFSSVNTLNFLLGSGNNNNNNTGGVHNRTGNRTDGNHSQQVAPHVVTVTGGTDAAGGASGAGGGEPPDPPLTPDQQRASYSETFGTKLNEYAQANNLSQDDINKLQFAFFNPEAAALTGNAANGQPLSDILKSIQTDAQAAALANGIDVTKLSPQVNNADFNLNISDTYNIGFEKLVGQDPNLTEAQKGLLIFMHYNPDVTIPNLDPQMAAKLAELQGKALSDVQGAYGAPANWQPKLNSELFNGVLTSQFQVNLQLNLDDYVSKNNISTSDQKLIQQAIENPNANVPQNIRDAANAILNKTIADTKTQNDLPIDWKPADLTGVFQKIANDSTAAGFINLRSMINSAMDAANLLPEGPEKQKTIDLLQTISAAIILMQKTIYETELAHSETAKNEALAKKGSQDLQIKLQDAQNKETAEQLKKQQDMGIMMKIFGPIMKVFAAIMALITAGALGVLFFILDQTLNLGDKFMTALMNSIADTVSKIPDNGNPDMIRFKEAIEASLKIVTLVVLMTAPLASSVTSLLIGTDPITAIQNIIQKSGIVQDICQSWSISKKDADYVAMAVGIAFTVAVAVASFLVPGAGVAGVMGAVGKGVQVATQIVEAVTNTFQKVVNIIKDIRIIAEIMKIASKVADTVQTVAKAVVDAVAKVASKVVDAVSSLFEKVLTKILQLVEKFTANQTIISNVMKGVQVAQGVIGTTNAALQGGINVSQAKVALAKAKYEPDIEELNQIIKNLQGMIDMILDGLSKFGDAAISLRGVMDNLRQGLSETLNKTTSIVS